MEQKKLTNAKRFFYVSLECGEDKNVCACSWSTVDCFNISNLQNHQPHAINHTNRQYKVHQHHSQLNRTIQTQPANQDRHQEKRERERKDGIGVGFFWTNPI